MGDDLVGLLDERDNHRATVGVEEGEHGCFQVRRGAQQPHREDKAGVAGHDEARYRQIVTRSVAVAVAVAVTVATAAGALSSRE
eukprot:CAMPEP_0179903600 /NCGR_PEP_ID=MMETSP0982-20121206/41373_1 /TAXON_ID=483367 /ORGANISM="non described non described, Strain CCMP 2436" /LENGTH=83 /DNA_ID=CAMNT_0021803203 /DNA_START=374 /DNA_END=625 /DNA_ORIENTATION=+